MLIDRSAGIKGRNIFLKLEFFFLTFETLRFETLVFVKVVNICTAGRLAAGGGGNSDSETTTMELLASPYKLESAFRVLSLLRVQSIL